MRILRQKMFAFFGLFEKKKNNIEKEKQYSCPTIKDLQKSNLSVAQGLKAFSRLREKPETKRTISELKDLYLIDSSAYSTYIDDNTRYNFWKSAIEPSLKSDNFPEDTLMFPLIWNSKVNDGICLCWDCSSKKFWTLFENDWTFEEERPIKISEWVSKDLDYILYDLKNNSDPDLIQKGIELIKRLKKLLWLIK